MLRDLGIIRGFMLVNMQLCFRSVFFFVLATLEENWLRHTGLVLVLLFLKRFWELVRQ